MSQSGQYSTFGFPGWCFTAFVPKRALIVVVTLILADVVRGQATDPFPKPAPEPDLPQGAHDTGRRPSFLPVPQPASTPRAPEPAPEPTKTIITQVEVPVPEPVAEQPNSAAPESSPTPEAGSPQIIFGGPNQPNQPSQPEKAQASPTPVQDPMALLKAGQYDEVEAIATSRQDA
ncbi:MAG TPA: hypothetical protein VHS80_17700, partial [Chthoniobacterales bacterium]|nr:hypothetical protein [Chthoniobacterales bacterium]